MVAVHVGLVPQQVIMSTADQYKPITMCILSDYTLLHPGCSRTAWGQAARLMGGMQVMVAGCMASKLRPHQWEGVRFLWDNIVSQYEVHT